MDTEEAGEMEFVVEGEDEQEQDEVLDDSSGSDCSDESESELASINEWDGLLDRCEGQITIDDCSFVYHTVWHTLHKRNEGSLGRTMCGKVITYKYETVHNEPAFTVPLCKVCFKNAGE
jgi:hypothetical protein